MATRKRLFQSSMNGVRIMRFDDGVEDFDPDDPEDWSEEGLNRLEDLTLRSTDEYWGLNVDSPEHECSNAPVLCLTGQVQSELKHEPGCSHEWII